MEKIDPKLEPASPAEIEAFTKNLQRYGSLEKELKNHRKKFLTLEEFKEKQKEKK